MPRWLLVVIGLVAGCSSGGQGTVPVDAGPDAATVDAAADVFRRDVTFVYPEAAPPPGR